MNNWIWFCVCGMAVTVVLALSACNPSPHAKAVLADEQIRAEFCQAIFPKGTDGVPAFTISSHDTTQTKAEYKIIMRYLTAYCQ